MKSTLNELLDLGQRYGPEYRGGLSNHLPMALVALHALGADEGRLREFFHQYERRLVLSKPVGRIRDDWASCLGHVDTYSDLLETFGGMLREEGAEAVLRRTLPVLMTGVGAAAFHGLIRTAYGQAAGHDGETAAGLAYWACRYLPLGAESMADADQRDPVAWIDTLARDLSSRAIPDGGLIFERMRTVASHEAFTRRAGRLLIDDLTLTTMANFAAQRYLATRNFTVLHLVTSCHAMRVLLPWVDDRQAALAAYARAYAAGCITSKIDLHSPPSPRPATGWLDVTRRAIASDDEHVVKLVHSCREEASIYGEGARLHAAGLAAG